MIKNKIYKGNCVDVLKKIPDEYVDLIYLDPPFFTQRKHSLRTKDNSKKYEFADKWETLEDYLQTIEDCLIECQRVLKKSGNIFLHCDKAASHHLRVKLDRVFRPSNFRSEIIWSYRRWSNSKKGLLNSHQTIYYYSKTKDFNFNTIYTDYSATTNIDQILQDRVRDSNGKSVYKKSKNGEIVLGKAKKGVPLSDVWEIPYLNPKAKERVGYPTQKPVLLLNQILKIGSNEGDLVLDPYCGSGTTCVAAKHLNREFIGIDISEDAVDLANLRIDEMIITESNLLKKGKKKYIEKTDKELAILKSINAFAVQRNSGIDGFLDIQFEGKPIPIKIQSESETIEDCIEKIEKACHRKGYPFKIVIQTRYDLDNSRLFSFNSNVQVIRSTELKIKKLKEEMQHPTKQTRS